MTRKYMQLWPTIPLPELNRVIAKLEGNIAPTDEELEGNIAPTDEELEANIREEKESYDWRIVRQRRAREEYEKRHGQKPVGNDR